MQEQDLSRIATLFPNLIIAAILIYFILLGTADQQTKVDEQKWVNQNYAQNIVYFLTTFPFSNKYLDLAIIRIFPYHESIQPFMKLGLDHFLVLVDYWVDSYNPDLDQFLTTM